MLHTIVESIFSRYLEQSWKGLEAAQRDPQVAQQQAYRRLRRGLRGTRVAGLTGLDSSRSYEDFAKTARANTYDDFKTLVDLTVRGDGKNLLFKDRPRFVGLSSGTTGHNSKQIIYNKGMAQAFDRYQIAVASILKKHCDYSFLSQDRLTWGSSPVVAKTETGVSCGYVSGFLATHAHPLSRSKSLPSLEVSSLSDMNEKIAQAGAEARQRDLQLISGVPSYIVNLLEELRTRWGIKDFSKVWPNLKTVIYSGTSIDPYRQQLQELLGQTVQFVGLYVSTEGPFGYEIPSLNRGENGVYAFHYGDLVYTFRRLNDPRGEAAPFLTVGELQSGDEVELFISSPNGLINYRTGDCLKIRSSRPLLFEVIGRIGHGLNVAAEKVSLSQINKTAARLSECSALGLRHYFVVPGQSARAKPCYDWILLADHPEHADIEVIRQKLDAGLMELNSDYRENREDLGFLDEPNVRVLGSDLAHQYFEKASHRGQLKMKVAFDSLEKLQSFLNEMGLAEAV